MNPNRRFNSIARRIHRAWQWKKLRLIVCLDAVLLLTALAAFLYAQETAVTGAFAGWGIPRRLTAQSWRLEGLEYRFVWQESEHAVDLKRFMDLAVLFGRPLLIAEGIFWILGFPGGGKDARRLLKPLDRMARVAQQLTDAAAERKSVDPSKFRDLEQAIEQIDIGGKISTGDKDLKGLEDAINDMLARMHDAYRQQAQFVSDASHELRTPIAVIQGYARMLDRWGKDDEKVLAESIAAIRSETEHMKTLVEQLLFLARGDSGRQAIAPEEMDLAELMREVLEEYRMIDTAHDWRSGGDESVPVTADPALLKQAARILIDNAARYTPEGGSIRLSAGSDAQNAWIEVQDAGIGIGEADVPRIFDRFYRADPARTRASGGTGLGLSIAKWIADRHEGWFEVVSRPELGTRIRLVIPAGATGSVRPEEKKEARTGQAAADGSASGGRDRAGRDS